MNPTRSQMRTDYRREVWREVRRKPQASEGEVLPEQHVLSFDDCENFALVRRTPGSSLPPGGSDGARDGLAPREDAWVPCRPSAASPRRGERRDTSLGMR